MDPVDRLVEEIHAADPLSGIRIVGIDGPAGAGKSTLAARLASVLGAPVIEVDDFVSWSNFAGWWPRFETQVLDPLMAGRAAHYQRRDWAGDWFGDSLADWTPWSGSRSSSSRE